MIAVLKLPVAWGDPAINNILFARRTLNDVNIVAAVVERLLAPLMLRNDYEISGFAPELSYVPDAGT